MRIRLYRSGQALYGVVKALYWKSSKRQISTHLTVLKHQNTKTSLYKLSKNHWVIALLEIFGSVRKKLQFTVFNDHPVQFTFRKFVYSNALIVLLRREDPRPHEEHRANPPRPERYHQRQDQVPL